MQERRGRGWMVTAIVAVALIALTASVAAARPPTRPTTNVTAYVAPHRQLSYNPVLQVGAPVRIAVTGFASRALVTMQLVSTSYRKHIRADEHGVARETYVVQPGRAGGHYLITFQGQPFIPSRVNPRAADPVQSSGSADQQTITATVPRIGLFPYRLAGEHSSGGSGVEGVSIHEPADAPGSGLAVTGADIAGAVALALAACLAGVLALRAGRRRRS
jgi:hypothetical protein